MLKCTETMSFEISAKNVKIKDVGDKIKLIIVNKRLFQA